MARDIGGLGYISIESSMHRLCGASKLLMVLFVSLAAMITYDTRFLSAIIVVSFVMFFMGRVPLRKLRFVLVLIALLMLMNNVLIFLFSPEEGVKIYGTRHEMTHLFLHYYLTKEQIFYQINVTLKYFSIMPLALIFLNTTEPSEFASSLNKIGVSYKVGYSVALALRYIPDVKREFHEISQAQQARGIDMSRKVKLGVRIKNTTTILFPLVFSSMDKIENITNAMELRSFGKNKKRTWYRARPFAPADYLLIVVSALMIAVSLFLNYLNGGRFYNPFL